MRKITLALALASLVGVAACKKTGENEYEVEKPTLGTTKDTVKTPDVDVGMKKDSMTVPTVDVGTKKKEVSVPTVDVKKP